MTESQTTASTSSSGMLPPPPPPPLPPSTEDSQDSDAGNDDTPSSVVESDITEDGKKRKATSWVWTEGHFVREKAPSIMEKCTHCKKSFKAHTMKNGTSSLIAHLKRCPKYTQKDTGQKSLDFQPSRPGESEKLVAVSFSQDACRKA